MGHLLKLSKQNLSADKTFRRKKTYLRTKLIGGQDLSADETYWQDKTLSAEKTYRRTKPSRTKKLHCRLYI
jgi:hypothetical protein